MFAQSPRVHERLAQSTEPTFAFEYFVPDTDEGAQTLAARIDRMAPLEPLYVDVYAVPEAAATQRALTLCRHARHAAGLPTMLHLSCAGTTVEGARRLLDEAHAAGVTNVIVERGVAPPPVAVGSTSGDGDGDAAPPPAPRPPFHATPGGFRHAAELVAWVRATYGDHFSVGVMGFPSGAGEYGSVAEDEAAMRDKAAAGAHFVLAQHVHDAGAYAAFVQRLRAGGIALPVVASVLVLQDAASFAAVNAYAGVPPPPALASALADAAGVIGGDAAAARAAGRRAAVALCAALVQVGAPALHVITLNLEAAVRGVLAELRLAGPGAAPRRRLPWRPSADAARSSEAVRPVHWAMRPASYVERTSAWVAYPSGRWTAAGAAAAAAAEGGGGGGGAWPWAAPGVPPPPRASAPHRRSSPSPPPPPPSAGPSARGRRAFQPPPAAAACDAETARARRALWGETLHAPEDAWDVFARFVEGAVPRLPWCDEAGLRAETALIAAPLAALNRAGFLTINSQPRVNGARSDDPVVGWGAPGGYVYQKAFVECFCDPAHLGALMDAAARHPSITFQAIDAGDNAYASGRHRGAQAITWGVFPGAEVVQPTVVDAEAFLAWKAEAFTLWRDCWGAAYDEDSRAREVIADIHDTYFLVNVVDHDFVHGDIMAVFGEAVSRLEAAAPLRGGAAPLG